MALKSARIVDFCGKSSGLVDFENTVDRGSAVIFDTDSGLCLSYVRILGLDLSSSLVGMLMSPSKLFLFFERSSFKLGCDTVIITVLCFSHHECCLLYIWAKLTVVFTSTSFPFNLNTCVIGCGCGFGFKQKFWRIDGFGEIKARIGGFAYPYSPPSRRIDRLRFE